MATPLRLRVRIDPVVWIDEVERFGSNRPARIAAERERDGLGEGIELPRLRPCSAEGSDRTSLSGLVKTYVPIGDLAPFGAAVRVRV